MLPEYVINPRLIAGVAALEQLAQGPFDPLKASGDVVGPPLPQVGALHSPLIVASRDASTRRQLNGKKIDKFLL